MSMLRSYTPADVLTIGNASCGTVAIFLCLDYVATGIDRFLWVAFVVLPLALVCDVLDGLVARATPADADKAVRAARRCVPECTAPRQGRRYSQL